MRLTLPIFVVIALLATSGLSAAPGGEDYRARFQAAVKAHDEKASQAALDEWKQAQPDDPEHDISAANYLLSKRPGVDISPLKTDADKPTVKEKGRTIYTMTAGKPSPESYWQAVELLKHGVAVAPQRMDIYLRLATLYQELNQPEPLVDDLSTMAAYAKAHPGALQGKNGQPFPEPADEELAREIGGLANPFFQGGTPQSDQAFHALAKLDAEAFPNRVYGHNLLGIYYTTIEKNPALALASYARALQIAPDDSYVWMNVGILHAREGDKPKAAAAFNKIIQLNNDPSCVKQAGEEIARLK